MSRSAVCLDSRNLQFGDSELSSDGTHFVAMLNVAATVVDGRLGLSVCREEDIAMHHHDFRMTASFRADASSLLASVTLFYMEGMQFQSSLRTQSAFVEVASCDFLNASAQQIILLHFPSPCACA